METIISDTTVLNVINGVDPELLINKRSEVVIHLMLIDSIHVTSKSLNDTRIKVSVDELNQRDTTTDDGINGDHKPSGVEISVLNENESKFGSQEPNGRLYSAKEYVIFRTKVTNIDEMVFTIDLYSSGSDSNANTKRIAFCNIFAAHLKDTNGFISMPFNTENGKIVAKLNLEYVIMSPIKGTDNFLAKLADESWLTTRKGYDVGHRGAGTARRTDRIENILENTIASFNFASLHVSLNIRFYYISIDFHYNCK
ncbi:unnamed protein product, partial [Medioppia subpectinata]